MDDQCTHKKYMYRGSTDEHHGAHPMGQRLERGVVSNVMTMQQAMAAVLDLYSRIDRLYAALDDMAEGSRRPNARRMTDTPMTEGFPTGPRRCCQ